MPLVALAPDAPRIIRKAEEILNADYRLAGFWQRDGQNAEAQLSAVAIF